MSASAEAVSARPAEQPPAWENLLAWSHPDHRSSRTLPCRHCAGRTHLRDEDGEPSHKTCAEQNLADRLTESPARWAAGA
jgi:hypothetical protein